MVFPVLNESHLEAICAVLGDTETGLSGSEIGRYLRESNIADTSPGITKRHRLYEALRDKQKEDRCANHVVAFIKRVMNPALYLQRKNDYEGRRTRLNESLSFCGYQINESGEIVSVTATRTISEAEQRANKLQAELRRRKVHHDVLKFCRSELLEKNYFHAVLEATKSVSEKIRSKSGLKSDGGELAQEAFSLGRTGIPLLAFNSLLTDTEKSEQKGLMNLFVGMFGSFRNVTAHGPKVMWDISEEDALDLLTLASLLHRRLDGAVFTRRINDQER